MTDIPHSQENPSIASELGHRRSHLVVQTARASAVPIGIALLLCHLILEYLRPQTFWPPLASLQLPAIALALLLLSTVSQLVRKPTQFARQTQLLLSFLALSTFSILYAANWFRASKFAYSIGLTMIGYLAIAHLVRQDRDLKKLLALLVIIHVLLSFSAILGFSHSSYNEAGYASTGYVGGGFLKDENDFALAINVILPLGLYMAAQARTVLRRVLWGSSCAVLLLTTVFTFSRGGFTGLAAIAVYWVATSPNKRRAIAVLGLGTTLILLVAPPQYWNRISTITQTDRGTAGERQALWASARLMFYDSPVWGVGGGNYGVHLPDYALDWEPDRRMNLWGKAVHSMYFQLLAEFGLVGVALISMTLVLNFRHLNQIVWLGKRKEHLSSLGLLASSLRASWVGFLVSATFLSVLDFPHLYYLTALTVALHRIALASGGSHPAELTRS